MKSNSEKTIKKQPKSASKPKSDAGSKKVTGRQIMNAIRRLQGSKGTQAVTITHIKNFLRTVRNIDTKLVDAEIKMYLKNALERGILTKEGANYKVAERVPKKNIRKRGKTAPQELLGGDVAGDLLDVVQGNMQDKGGNLGVTDHGSYTN